MSYRIVAIDALADLLGVLAHPDRILILQELQQGEREVKALKQSLGLSHSRVSQHLNLMRRHHLVAERRQGRHVLYHVLNPALLSWLMQSLNFVESRLQLSDEVLKAVADARQFWMSDVIPAPQVPPSEGFLYIYGANKSR